MISACRFDSKVISSHYYLILFFRQHHFLFALCDHSLLLSSLDPVIFWRGVDIVATLRCVAGTRT
jgi:hypothetical protein